jgi:hypothetical protein
LFLHLKGSFAGGEVSHPAWIDAGGRVKRSAKSFENRFGPVMVVSPVQQADV